MITELTPEQTAQFEVYVNKWNNIGRDNSPLNKDKVISILKRLQTVDEVYFTKSPMSTLLFGMLYEKGVDVKSLCDENRHQKVSLDELKSFVLNKYKKSDVKSYVDTNISKCFLGQQENYWLSFYDYFKNVVNLDFGNIEHFQDIFDLSIESNWIFQVGNTFFISEKHESIAPLDDRNLAHCETGPYIRYSDGFEVYCWHGVRIPGEWINDKANIDVAKIINWPNMEQRRAGCEIVGWANIIERLDGKVIDDDGDPEIGVLLEVNIPEIGKEKFLKVQCGTGRYFALPVPPEMKTALEAQSWTWNLSMEDWKKPEVRT